ncbi:Ycf66 family protein [Gloeocapsa sp. PCC 73106]|uniref:Ycf66 family protein n=1 Tax=Gloeocapsa sp. PCC 73106 TaxID=102232 RepID=UPI0002ABF8A8|nr:Ycf66 family protein [Gloeocapsa sp. PCC 73106]ELR96532.1 Ycf66 protein [Gloeocapsa sp. PCC 73106]
MLPYILAIAVGVSSLTFYLAAFFKPEIHRPDDFLRSGVGLFYALVLWICADRFTGAILLGQAAVVLSLLWYSWETIKLRRAIANPELAAEIESFSLLEWIDDRFSKVFTKKQLKPTSSPVSTPEPSPSVTITDTVEPISDSLPVIETVEQPLPVTDTVEQPLPVTDTVEQPLPVIDTVEQPLLVTEKVQAIAEAKKPNIFSQTLAGITNIFRKPKAENLSQNVDDSFDSIPDIDEEELESTTTPATKLQVESISSSDTQAFIIETPEMSSELSIETQKITTIEEVIIESTDEEVTKITTVEEVSAESINEEIQKITTVEEIITESSGETRKITTMEEVIIESTSEEIIKITTVEISSESPEEIPDISSESLTEEIEKLTTLEAIIIESTDEEIPEISSESLTEEIEKLTTLEEVIIESSEDNEKTSGEEESKKEENKGN